MTTIHNILKCCHDFLMQKGIPYSSVSVIHRSQDLGFHCIFMEDVRDMVGASIRKYLDEELPPPFQNQKFTYSFVKKSNP